MVVLKDVLKTLRNCTYDCFRYLKLSGTLASSTELGPLVAKIVMDFHRIEKGLSLPSPRPGFGTDVVSRLVSNLKLLEELHPASRELLWAKEALVEYKQFNLANGIENLDLNDFLLNFDFNKAEAGTLLIHADEISQKGDIDFLQFANSRHSVRNFEQTTVDRQLVLSSVDAARRSPSVCNRQSARVHLLTDEPIKKQALEIQGGNKGFGDQVPCVLIITSEMKSFLTPGERYQCWIDAGLFAMSLVYALHANGLASCMLNWSVDVSRDRKLRSAVSIPDSENIIMMIAFGHRRSITRVAASPRLSVSEILTEH